MREVKLLKHLPWLVLFLLFAAGSTLWLLFVAEQQSHLKVAFENQLERLSDELLRSRLEGRLGPDGLPGGIRTFAVYGPRGELVGAWGIDAPGRIDANRAEQLRQAKVSSKHQEGWVEFLKVLEPLRPRMSVWNEEGDDDLPRPGMGPGAMGRRSQGYLFLRVSDAPLEGRLWIWSVGGGLGVLAWAGFLTFIGLLWFRTRRYQAALVQHRELLQFAEASRTLSHELQNPLAAILLQTALLKRSSGGKPPSEVSIIEEEAQRMSALVARVRDFLKDPQGQKPQKRQKDPKTAKNDHFPSGQASRFRSTCHFGAKLGIFYQILMPIQSLPNHPTLILKKYPLKKNHNI